MRISDWSSDVCSSDLKAISLDSYDPARTLAYFQSYPPQTASGQLRYALALNAAGRREDANAAVRRAWTSGPLDDYETSRAPRMFPGAITPPDHAAPVGRAASRERGGQVGSILEELANTT